MYTILRSLLIQVLFLAPSFCVIFWIVHKWAARRARSKVPFPELTRRPAGESLRLKLETLDERILTTAAGMVMVPVLLSTAVATQHPINPILLVMLALTCLVGVAFLGLRFWRLAKERANHQLGFDGERFVAEVINHLIAHKFEVYHDLPFDGFNIDHVLVGPQGVFVVETKTRRKPVTSSGDKQYRVEFDGFRVHWPMGADSYGLDQAANNARTLSQWLSGAVGEPISATPILTFPGWMVDRKAPGKGVHVVNPKEIIKVCNGREARLDDTLIRRICYQLDQKCKLSME